MGRGPSVDLLAWRTHATLDLVDRACHQRADGAGADLEYPGNFTVREALGTQLQALAFSRRERRCTDPPDLPPAVRWFVLERRQRSWAWVQRCVQARRVTRGVRPTRIEHESSRDLVKPGARMVDRLACEQRGMQPQERLVKQILGKGAISCQGTNIAVDAMRPGVVGANNLVGGSRPKVSGMGCARGSRGP